MYNKFYNITSIVKTKKAKRTNTNFIFIRDNYLIELSIDEMNLNKLFVLVRFKGNYYIFIYI